MKLLFDQNISFRLISKILIDSPYSHSLRVVGLNDATDVEIWRFAKPNDYAIVTFDSDFLDLNTLDGSPPQVIWPRTGNTTTDNLAELLISRNETNHAFLKDKDSEILQILSDS